MARTILGASTLFLLAVGVASLFLPEIVARGFRMDGGVGASQFQLLAGGALGFAGVNWVGRGAIYGGIYGRPIVVGNLAHGLIVGFVMLRWQLDGPGAGLGWALTGGFLLYAAAFFMLLRWSPWRPGSAEGSP